MKSRSDCFEKGPRGPSFRHLGFGLGLFLGRGVETKQRKKIDENSFIFASTIVYFENHNSSNFNLAEWQILNFD